MAAEGCHGRVIKNGFAWLPSLFGADRVWLAHFPFACRSKQWNSQWASRTVWNESNRWQFPVLLVMFCNIDTPKKPAMTHSQSRWSSHPVLYSIGSLCDGFGRYWRVESLTEIGDEIPPRVAET
jgi:hypothetical protein